MRTYYVCKVCSKTIYSRLMPSHVKEHNMSIIQYYDTYINPDAIKKCICGNDLHFRKLSRGYGNVCSKRCATKKLLSTMIQNNPDHQKIAGRLGGKKNNGKGIIIARQKHPEIFENIRQYGVDALKELHKFKKEHQNMTPTEWSLWIHPEFQKLKPISLDTRFLKKFGDSKTYKWAKGICMDFSLPQYKLCIEIDGKGKNHYRDLDEKRDFWLFQNHNWKTLRFKYNESTDAIISKILRYINESIQ